MRWQRAAQAVIAILVIGFIAVLVTTLRQERGTAPQDAPPSRIDPTSTLETQGGGSQRVTDPSGKERWAVRFETHVALPDGRSRLSGGVDVTINRGDGPLTIKADEVDVTQKEGTVEPSQAVFRGNVRLTGGGGLTVTTEEATYTGADGMITIPGPVDFTKGRMRGSGVGATYDQERGVLWILDKAQVAVAAGPDGKGTMNASATKVGFARAEHYLVLDGSGRIDGEGRVIQADVITIRLTEDDARVRLLELREKSQITGGAGGPQAMSAHDIDLTYADDGRTLQFAKLAGDAVLQLPGEGRSPGKKITGDGIELTMGPDGTTVTGLTANGNVQVDLPAEGETPARRIRSATLTAAGPSGGGLQTATFNGGVEYRETRAGRKGAAALDRTARSQALVLDTSPGLGALQKADFRGNVQFTDAPDVRAEAQQGVYHIAGDRLDLMPAEGQPGPASPRVTNGKVSVAARTIQFTLSSGDMTAETSVRSTIMPQKSKGAPTDAKLPAMLAPGREVNVTSNRLHYQDTGATYSGNVALWQDKTTIKGAEIHIDEKSGNLTASGGATTFFVFDETDRKTGVKRPVDSTGKAETFTYDDAKRLATYTGGAQINGAQGNVSGDRILLFLKPVGNELERAEAFGTDGSVVVREGRRLANGNHLTYTSSDDNYVMIGTPVDVTEEEKGTCSRTLGAKVTFSRTSETASVEGNGIFPHTRKTLTACPAELAR